jgi:hypothetical protein
MKNITSIRFPNNQPDSEKTYYEIGKSGVTEIIPILKSGELAGIQWFQIVKGNKIIAEIKESVCDVFGEDEFRRRQDFTF